jgi:hypothetical protein
MLFPLRFHPEADLDVLNATLWYEEQRLGLGTEFLEQLSFLFERIANMPFQFPAIDGPIRRALLHRFPYGVYFDPKNEEVNVLAVLHLLRYPDTWKERRS